jgi:hypothetical protein
MKNIEMAVKGTILTLTVDLSKRFGRSSTGKTEIVATSAGAVSPAGFPDVKIGLNVFTK